MQSPTGMRAFLIVWFGQVISLIGTAMTQFAIAIWAWELTGEATALAAVAFFSFAPSVLFSPIAGALVDRSNRKLVMMLSDLAAGVTTIALFLLYTSGNLQIWHLFVAGAIEGTFQAFQWPAYSAAISTMIPKEQYARANGLMSLAESGSGILAPVLAGALYAVVQLGGIMLLDIVTFIVAIGALFIVHIPQPEVSEAGRAGKGSIWKESVYGFRYIFARPSLLGLQLVFFFANLTGSIYGTLLRPMILSRTGDNTATLGFIEGVASAGAVVGGVLLSTWGGPKRRVHGVLAGIAFSAVFSTVLGLGNGILIWAGASFLASLFIPILNGSNQAIWQAKVAPDVQGRVFATRRLIAQISGPVSMLLAGVLADKVFEPAMREGGSLAGVFGGLVGVGPGAGMALLIVIAGIAGVILSLGGYLFPAVRYAEDILPDHDAKVDEEAPAAATEITEAAGA
jgi:DHA3 family macrolide efflux protein-like MFS transporter